MSRGKSSELIMSQPGLTQLLMSSPDTFAASHDKGAPLAITGHDSWKPGGNLDTWDEGRSRGLGHGSPGYNSVLNVSLASTLMRVPTPSPQTPLPCKGNNEWWQNHVPDTPRWTHLTVKSKAICGTSPGNEGL